MSGLESDTIGGFNAFLAKQQSESGACRLTTVLFDNEYELLHDRIDIEGISPIGAEQYFVRGSTALLDAIGRSIRKIDSVQNNTAADYRAAKVLFVITTDGMENSSREFDAAKIKGMIEQHKRDLGWEFIFLGANIDAVEVAGRFGIDAEHAQEFHNDSQGIATNFKALSDAVVALRTSPKKKLAKNWNAEIQADFAGRRRGKK